MIKNADFNKMYGGDIENKDVLPKVKEEVKEEEKKRGVISEGGNLESGVERNSENVTPPQQFGNQKKRGTLSDGGKLA
jgi:hypothetical protein